LIKRLCYNIGVNTRFTPTSPETLCRGESCIRPNLFGFRIQKSVFECRMDRRAKEELIGVLEKLNLKTGFVKIYRLEYSWKNCVVGEQKKKNIDDEPAFIV